MLHSGTARTDSGTGAGALVRMASVDEAAQAIAHLHNQRLAGSVMPLVVRFADTQVRACWRACLGPASGAGARMHSKARGHALPALLASWSLGQACALQTIVLLLMPQF